ncbi:MAG: hypothetical protein ABIK09_12695 [Pseudomonadota bacterium]
MRPLLLWVALLSLVAGCGGGDPPAPQFNLDGFQTTDTLEDVGGDALSDTPGDLPGDLPPDLPPDLAPDEVLQPDTGDDVVPDVEPGCSGDDECLDVFEEIPACQRPACALGVCLLIPTEDGEPCADDDPCTANETCLEGACAIGTFSDCDDGDPCTDDACEGVGGCAHAPNTAACDDGIPCTVEDACAEGLCVGQPNSCDDDNPCTFDGCEPVTGACLHEAAVIPCNDENACTTNDFCVAGFCNGINLLACDDGNPCTDDGCAPQSGCVHTPNDAPCDDGEACTPTDSCLEGICTGLENVCLCEGTTDCQPLQDNDLCNGSLACIDGLCQIAPETVVSCDDPDPDDCVEFKCDPATGGCQAKSKGNGGTCDDHDVCTLGESCLTGLCAPAETVNCGDGELCTADTCDPGEGCQTIPSLAPCNDGDPCTLGDACTEGLLCVGEPLDCDDGDPCTFDGCDEALGACAHTPKPCDDEDLCTDDGCDGDSGACLFTAMVCSDGDLCTTDSCDPATGGCTYEAMECDDGDPCTQDIPDCVAQACTHVPTICDDQDACTTDSCAPDSGDCVHAPVTCQDGDLCTDDACEPVGGCVFTPVACDDQDACTADSCAPDSGCVFTPVTCDDGSACTTDSCAPASGCVFTPVTCDDGSACTTDSCAPASGCVFAPISCDDQNGCTDDTCAPDTGCVFTPNSDPCDDGDACTAGDACKDGACQSSILLLCADMNPCTDDACDPQIGCVFTPNTDPCDDGDACTENDVCAAGSCTGPDKLDCNDQNPCTGDSCAPDSGCLHAPLTGQSCDDDDACTVGDTCLQGTCSPGANVCAPCDGLQDGDACSDGKQATLADMCVQGACVGWTRADFEPRPGTLSGALTDVAWSSGQFLAVGRDTAGVGGGQETYTWAVTLDGGDVALYHDDSERMDTIYVAVSNDLAVGADGSASHYDGTWSEAGELEGLLDEGISFSGIRSLWGGRFANLSNGAPRIDRWWFLGRNVANTLGLTKLCTREAWPGGAVSWECENMLMDTYAEYEYPAAMDALLKPQGAGWQLNKAYLVSDAISQLGDTTTHWLDAFTTSDLDDWNFLGYLSDPPPYGQDWDDVAAINGNDAWAVGSRGLIARIHSNQLDKISASSPSLAQTDWTSAFPLGGLLVITGVRTTDAYSNQGLQRTRTFLVRTHRGTNQDTGWVNHTLGSVSTLCAGVWGCNAIVDGNHLTESAAHGSEAYLVGRGWAPSVQPDQDPPSPGALLYHLDVPTL